MGGATLTEADGWTLETESWSDLGGVAPDRPIVVEPGVDRLVDLLPRGEYDDHHFQVAVTAPGESAPSLVVAMGYSQFADALLVPETSRVFVGGGERFMAWHREAGRWWRDWERAVEVCFWGLVRHDDMVLMLSELELAAWSLDGLRRWSIGVEPPWGYTVEGDVVRVDVMGRELALDLRTGPPVRLDTRRRRAAP